MSGSTIGQSLGIISIIWGGLKIAVDAKSSKFTMGGLVGKPVIAGKTVFQAQQFMNATAQASFPLPAGFSMTKFIALNGGELQVQCDTGQKYIADSAFLSKDPEVKGGEGNNVSAQWASAPFVESLN